MTEELRSRQFFRDGAAVYSDKRLIASFAKLVNAVRHIFFSGSAETVDEYGHIGRGYQANVIVELLGCVTFSF